MYVELKNINKTYGSYQASRNVNFGIEKGKLIGLLGPSGFLLPENSHAATATMIITIMTIQILLILSFFITNVCIPINDLQYVFGC